MNPFEAGTYDGRTYYHADGESRLRAVKAFDEAQCRAALKLADLQVAVRRAIEVRLRKLAKAASA